jgi:hypothetical protein
MLRSRLPLLAVVSLLGLALLAPAASASPASAGHATTTAKKAKPCKRKKGETKKHWLKRCKCKAFKKGETRKHFKQRCPGAKVPKRKAPSGGGQTPPAGPPVPATPPGPAALTGQAAIDYVNAAMKGMRISRTQCSGTSCDSSVTEYVDFCQDGATFQGRRTTQGLSGAVYEVNFAGTYKVLEAGVNAERSGAQARVNSQITQSSGNDDPPPSGEGIVTFVGANQVYLGQTEYTRGQGQC